MEGIFRKLPRAFEDVRARRRPRRRSRALFHRSRRRAVELVNLLRSPTCSVLKSPFGESNRHHRTHRRVRRRARPARRPRDVHRGSMHRWLQVVRQTHRRSGI